MQFTLISGTILVTNRPIVVFPIGYMHHMERRLSIDLLDVLYETEVYTDSAPSNFAGPILWVPILRYSNFATETNLHLRKPRYNKMVISINFLMDNDNVYVCDCLLCPPC